MDPHKTLIEADQAISDREFGTAVRLLSDYATWRNRGGWEPRTVAPLAKQAGDRVYVMISDRLADRVDALLLSREPLI